MFCFTAIRLTSRAALRLSRATMAGPRPPSRSSSSSSGYSLAMASQAALRWAASRKRSSSEPSGCLRMPR